MFMSFLTSWLASWLLPLSDVTVAYPLVRIILWVVELYVDDNAGQNKGVVLNWQDVFDIKEKQRLMKCPAI